jgi:hypothetical protein
LERFTWSYALVRGSLLFALLLGLTLSAQLTFSGVAHASVSQSSHELPWTGEAGVSSSPLCATESPGYDCTVGGYASWVAHPSGWAWNYYGGAMPSHNSYGPHNCTLYVAYRLQVEGITLSWRRVPPRPMVRRSIRPPPWDRSPNGITDTSLTSTSSPRATSRSPRTTTSLMVSPRCRAASPIASTSRGTRRPCPITSSTSAWHCPNVSPRCTAPSSSHGVREQGRALALRDHSSQRHASARYSHCAFSVSTRGHQVTIL